MENKMDVNNLGRQLYRQAQWNKAFSSLFSANALAQVNSKDRNVYQMLIDEILGIHQLRCWDNTISGNLI